MLTASLDRIVEDLDAYNAQWQMLNASLDRIVEGLDVYKGRVQLFCWELAIFSRKSAMHMQLSQRILERGEEWRVHSME